MRSKGTQVFAVMRIELPPPAPEALVDAPRFFVSVKEVLPTAEEAEQEAQRLNGVNAGKALYYTQITRFYAEGRLAGS